MIQHRFFGLSINDDEKCTSANGRKDMIVPVMPLTADRNKRTTGHVFTRIDPDAVQLDIRMRTAEP